MNANFNYPAPVRFGAGRIRELPDACRELGMARPLIVTDAGLAVLPMIGAAADALGEAGLSTTVFSEVRTNPGSRHVAAGVDAYRAHGADGVVAFGGGSALDVGKAVALMSGQRIPLWDLEDIGDNWTRADEGGMAPVVAVPTTSGTGSEVGRGAVITDEPTHTKRILFHPSMLPGRVVCDPELTLGLPPALTAWVGVDALSHNLEAWCATGFHPLADGIALEGMRLVHRSLERAVEHGGDIEARAQMMAASLMGATAFQKGLGAMHAMAHPIGAVHDTHHGLTNGIVMPYVLEHNRPAIGERLSRAAAYMGLAPGPDGFIAWILELRERLQIPETLDGVGITPDAAAALADAAAADAAGATNPVPLDVSSLGILLRRAAGG